MKKAKAAIVVVGIASIFMATAGLLYNLVTLSVDMSEFAQDPDLPYLYPAFYTMSAVCISCYAALLACGIQFARMRTGLLWLFVVVIASEVVYFFAVAMMWLIPDIGMSVGAATGIANGGLAIQAFVLFPLWAPPVAIWASSRISSTGETPEKALSAGGWSGDA